MDGRGSREFCSLMRRECLEKTELERSKFVIRNSEVGMEPTPSSYRPEQTKRKTHPFKGQNRKGRAPRRKQNQNCFSALRVVHPRSNQPCSLRMFTTDSPNGQGGEEDSPYTKVSQALAQMVCKNRHSKYQQRRYKGTQ